MSTSASKLIKLQGEQRLGAEQIATRWFLPIAGVALVVWYLIFFLADSNGAPIIGWPSIGGAAIISTSVAAFFIFAAGYFKSTRTKSQFTSIPTKGLGFWTSALTVAVAYTVIVAVLGAILSYVFSLAFVGLHLPVWSAAIIVGAYTGIMSYLLIATAFALETQDIVNAFSIFMIGGVFISMATAPNPNWWTANFSSLGETNSFSSATFNITLILSGVLIVTMVNYLLTDLHVVVQRSHVWARANLTAVRWVFVFMALSLAGVGLFPYDIHPSLHNFSAYAMVITFGVLVVGMRWFMPDIGRDFLKVSYVLLAFEGLNYVLFNIIHATNLTAFELTSFALVFGWLILFLRNITLLKDEVLRAD